MSRLVVVWDGGPLLAIEEGPPDDPLEERLLRLRCVEEFLVEELEELEAAGDPARRKMSRGAT